MDARNSGQRPEISGWELVALGPAIPRSYMCLCCLTFRGEGMNRGTMTYCLSCWEKRQHGDPCFHKTAEKGFYQQAAG